jgi:hypothetical protein
LPLIIGLAFCAGGLVAPYVGVQSIPTNDPYMTSADYVLLIALFGLLVLICLGGGVTFVVMAVYARRRHGRRLAALDGDASLMPLARLHRYGSSRPRSMADSSVRVRRITTRHGGSGTAGLTSIQRRSPAVLLWAMW